MPIVYANIHQSIYCSLLTHLPSCLGFFYNIIKIVKMSLIIIILWCFLSELYIKPFCSISSHKSFVFFSVA